MAGFDIRDGVSSDAAKIERLYPEAFPDEELRPLVRALLRETRGVLSLVAIAEAALIGHGAFTPCGVSDGGDAAALLGPLAVAPAWQGRGVGSALVRRGLDRLRSTGVDHVFVLGDPAYYGRFGFQAERAVAAPFALPAEWRDAWQSITLRRTRPKRRGTLRVPRAWNEPTLWTS